MALPVVSPQKSEVELSDGTIMEVRGLTRKAALSMGDNSEDLGLTERNLLVAGLGATMKDVTDWYSQSASSEVEKVVKAILTLSGLDVDAEGKAS